MNYILSIFILLLQLNTLFGQVDNTRFLYIGKTDSVTMAIYHYHDREFDEVYSSENEKEPIKLLVSKQLKPSDLSTLNKKLLSRSSFKFERALPYHYNISISYYLNGSIIQDAEISTLTGNITIQKHDGNYTPDSIYTDEPNVDKSLFRYKVSKSFGNYLKKVLMSYQLWLYIEEGDKLSITD